MAVYRIRTALLALSLVLLPHRATSACAQIDKLSIQLSWVNSAEFAGFVVPNSGTPGIPQYNDECLDVQVRDGGVNFDPLQELADDKADMALCEAAYAAQRIANGEDLTIISSFYQLSSLALVGLHKVALASIQDLAAKRIGMGRQGHELTVKLMLKNSGVSQADMLFIDQSTSMLLPELKGGKVDVATATLYRDLGEVLRWMNPVTHFLNQEDELSIFKSSDSAAPAIHNVLVVKTAKLAAMRTKLVKFLRVVAKAWLHCRDNEDACMKSWPYSSALQRRLLRESLKLIFPTSAFGVLSPASWTAVNGALVTAGLIPARTYSAVDNTLIIEAANVNPLDVAAATAYSPDTLDLCAPYNAEAPLRICSGQEHTLCNQGYVPPATAGGTCVACATGRYSKNLWHPLGKSRMNVCQLCDSGRATNTTGSKECAACGPGKYRSPDAADYVNNRLPLSAAIRAAYASGTGCASCPPGHTAASTGQSSCDLCPKGRAAMSAASSTCDRCTDGTYATIIGMSKCIGCPSNTTTRGNGATYIYDCACETGTYRTAKGNCAACPEGFACNIGSDEAVLKSFGTSAGYLSGQYPQLLPGYWASQSDPLSVYKCRNHDFCPGGAPQTCGLYMEDIACSLCVKGYFRQGQKCEKCTGFDNTEFNYPTLPAVFGPFVVIALYYYMWDQADKWGSLVNELWGLAFLMLVHYQMVGVVLSDAIEWPSQIFGTIYVWEYFVDFSEMLRFECIGDSTMYRGFKNSYLAKAMQPLFLGAIFGLFYFVCCALATLGGCVRSSGQKWLDNSFKSCGMPRFTRGDPRLAVAPTVLFNNYMAIFQAFYISFCFISLELFMCYEHPNGKKMLRFGPTVECESEDWQRMIGEAVLMMIPICCIAVAGIIFAAVVAPAYFAEQRFRSACKFMLIKWRPDVWWWGVVVLLRAMLLCLTHVFFQEGQRQLLWQLAILLTYTGAAACLRPWRSWCGNVLDLEVCGSLILFISLSCNFVTRAAWLDDSIADFATWLAFIPAIVFVLVACWIACAGLGAQHRGPWNKKLGEDSQAAFAKFVGLDKKAAEAFVQKISGQDRAALRNVWFMITTELLQEPGRSRHFQWLVKRKEQERKEQAVAALQGPRPSLELEDPGFMDVGDVEEPSQWNISPPNSTVVQIPASRGDAAVTSAAKLKALGLDKPSSEATTVASAPVLMTQLQKDHQAAIDTSKEMMKRDKVLTVKRQAEEVDAARRKAANAQAEMDALNEKKRSDEEAMRRDAVKRQAQETDAMYAATHTAQQTADQAAQSSSPAAPAPASPPKPSGKGLPPGWRSASCADGREYYYHTSNPKETRRWKKPEADDGAGVGNISGTQAPAKEDSPREDGTRVVVAQPKGKK